MKIKGLILAGLISLSITQAHAATIRQCEGVDMEELKAKIEKVVEEGDMDKEVENFNREIKGKDRFCAREASIAMKAGGKLSKIEEDIAELYDLIFGVF